MRQVTIFDEREAVNLALACGVAFRAIRERSPRHKKEKLAEAHAGLHFPGDADNIEDGVFLFIRGSAPTWRFRFQIPFHSFSPRYPEPLISAHRVFRFRLLHHTGSVAEKPLTPAFHAEWQDFYIWHVTATRSHHLAVVFEVEDLRRVTLASGEAGVRQLGHGRPYFPSAESTVHRTQLDMQSQFWLWLSCFP
jgi:hypothetical protein